MSAVIAELLKFLGIIASSNKLTIIFVWIMFLTQIVLIYSLIVSLRNYKILAKRKELAMNEVEKTMEELFSLIWGKYLELAEKKLGDGYEIYLEIRLYRYILKYALKERLPEFRRRIRKNGFEEKDSGDWLNYVSTNIKEDSNKIINYIDENYHINAEISNSEINKLNKELMDNEIEDIMQKLYAIMLKISKDNKFKKFFGFKLML